MVTTELGLLSVRDIASQLDLTTQGVRLRLRRTGCPFARVGYQIVIRVEDAQKYLGYVGESER